MSKSHYTINLPGLSPSAILLVAVIVSFIPGISLIFNVFSVFLHEISHAIASWVTGGRVINMQLFWYTGGYTTTSGGNKFIIGFSGYAGVVLWGMLLLWVSEKAQTTQQLVIAIVTFLVFYTLFFLAKGSSTTIILLISLAWCSALFFLSIHPATKKQLLQFLGFYSLLEALKAPLYLIDGAHVGDGAFLQSETGIPELLWVIIWVIIGFVGLYFGLKRVKEK